MRSHLIERVVEIPASLLALIFFSPLMIAIAVMIKRDGGPVFYRQERIGRGGRRFTSLKFRSMAVDADVQLESILARDSRSRHEWRRQHRLQWDPRVTWIGEHLRRSSLDELPQLINVLRGEMSFVGPRPIVADEISRYGHRFARYCFVRPGLTGLWQLEGRKTVSYRRRVAIDVYYARHRSIGLYFAILVATIPTLFLES